VGRQSLSWKKVFREKGGGNKRPDKGKRPSLRGTRKKKLSCFWMVGETLPWRVHLTLVFKKGNGVVVAGRTHLEKNKSSLGKEGG